MLVFKILLAAIIVIGLAELAERSSTKMAGLLAGLPVGSALVLFFYGLDYGTDFVAQVTPYNLLGLSASLSFVSMYYVGSKLSERYSMVSGLGFGLVAYLVVAYALSYLHLDTTLIPGLMLLSFILITHIWFKEIRDVRGEKSGRLNLYQMLGRGVIATVFVLLASYSPYVFGDNMAGILSSFPSALLPLLLIIHASQGRDVVHSVIKYLPLGYVGVMIYSVSVGYLYGDFGIYIGTLLALVISTSYLVLLLSLSHFKSKRAQKALAKQTISH